jgi:NAD(P)-dependent dehydrogenase (short-subunit alcohol dehydrogenase family)
MQVSVTVCTTSHKLMTTGIMATPWSTTHEGFEAQFGTNYVGHALLTRLLLPIMTKTSELPNADVRIISVSSVGHNMAPRGGILFDEEALKALTPLQLYGQSKLANILLVKALAKRYPKIMSVAVHPGMIRTEIYSPIMKARWLINSALKIVGPLVFADVRFGALTQLWAATAPRKNVTNGTYYMPVGKDMGASKYSKDAELSEKLWKWTEEQFKQHGIPQT